MSRLPQRCTSTFPKGEVFFYPRSQEDLGGTNGLESMKEPFADNSRVNVVLYREPWGQTPWTRVEQNAIQERCLHGWDSLFFVTLDDASTLPKWLPPMHIQLNFASFGLEQAVGAIKNAVQRCGGIVSPMTALKRAERYRQEALYIADKKQISSFEGMAKVCEKVLELFAEIERLCAEIRANGHMSIRVGSNAGQCVLTNNRISLIVCWRQPYTNSMDGCALTVLEYNMQMELPNGRLLFVSEPEQLRKADFSPEISRARDYGWIEKGKPSTFLSSVELAKKCVIQFFDLAERADRGEIEPPRW
jgi:hypothetical protein